MTNTTDGKLPIESWQAKLAPIKIVMVNTTLPANIGAAARALKTMGLVQLVLVAPKTHPSADASATAAGAEDILNNASIVPTLAEALADCAFVLAASARNRSIPWPVLDVREATQQAVIEASTHPVAIVFGREDRGLTNEELALAHVHLTIPVNPAYGVLNVAAAIQIVCYELHIHAKAHQHTPLHSLIIDNEPLATAADMAQFHPQLEAMLHSIDFLDPDNPRLLPLRLKRLFARTRLNKMEYNLLRGMFSRIQLLAQGKWPPAK